MNQENILILNETKFLHFIIAEIHVRLPANVIAKSLKVNITNTSINVHSLTNGERQEILRGQFSGMCKALDAVWTITEGKKLNIILGWYAIIWFLCDIFSALFTVTAVIESKLIVLQ